MQLAAMFSRFVLDVCLPATGLAYAICCDILEQVDKQPGDSIPRDELKRLIAAAAPKAAAKDRQRPLLQLAADLAGYPCPGECIFVMPSLLSMLLTGLAGPAGHKALPAHLSLMCTNDALGEMEGDFQYFLQGGSPEGGASIGSNPMLAALQELLLATFSKQPTLEVQQGSMRQIFDVLLRA
jgi:hypothetical protein